MTMRAQRLSQSLDNLLFDYLYTIKYIKAEELVMILYYNRYHSCNGMGKIMMNQTTIQTWVP